MYVYTDAEDERLHLIESYSYLVVENDFNDYNHLSLLSKVFFVILSVTRVGNEGALV